VLRPDFERTEEEKEKKESTFLSNARFFLFACSRVTILVFLPDCSA